jgi:hypothetical protein
MKLENVVAARMYNLKSSMWPWALGLDTPALTLFIGRHVLSVQFIKSDSQIYSYL